MRPDYFREQLSAILNQTILPYEIIVGHIVNKRTPEYDFTGIDKVISYEFDPGFHTKFVTALTAQGDFVAIFDDDTIPGKRWLENCLNSFEKQEGLYGPFGVKITNPSYRRPIRVSGFNHQSDKSVEVDFMGQSWFMPYSYLHYMWIEQPPFYNNAEDIFFSYQLQKYGNIKVYVPPHSDNPETWGSTKPEYGLDGVAISIRKYDEHNKLRDEMVRQLIEERGWKPLYIRELNKEKKL